MGCVVLVLAALFFFRSDMRLISLSRGVCFVSVVPITLHLLWG
ncbi:MAG: hypothetical protein JWQ44_1953 [Chthoniobacter sp.]|nr:hypothetical protein [Chthoniobacter sp.]